jgi:tetratricopeptide (TPR) repeat protein
VAEREPPFDRKDVEARAHYDRYWAENDPAALDDAIASAQAALSLASTPVERIQALSTIGSSLQARYWRTSSLADLTAAIETFREGAALFRDDKSHLQTVYGLASSLLERFRLTAPVASAAAARSDLDESIEQFTFAVSLIMHNELDRMTYLTAVDDLGTAYRERYELTGNDRDYQSAIECHKTAFKFLPPLSALIIADIPHLQRTTALCMRHTGEAFLARYQVAHDEPSLARAVRAFGDSVRLDSDPLTCIGGGAAWYAVAKTRGAPPFAAEHAREYLRRAVVRGLEVAPLVALRASRKWLEWLFDGTVAHAQRSDTLTEAVEAVEAGLEATRRITMTQVDRTFEAEARRQIAGFGAEAAFAFAELGNTARLAEVAETTAASMAGDVQKEVSDELEQLVAEGDHALVNTYRSLIGVLRTAPSTPEPQEIAQPEGSLGDVIAQIRARPGHALFASASDPAALRRAEAPTEDWLYILASPWGTVALALRHDGSSARAVIDELPRGRVEQMVGEVSRLSDLRLSRRRRDRIAEEAIDVLANDLWEPLYSRLDLGRAPLTIFPGGLFALLPLEAGRLKQQERRTEPGDLVRMLPSAALWRRSARGRSAQLDSALIAVDAGLPGALDDLRIVHDVLDWNRFDSYVAAERGDDVVIRDLMTDRSLIHFACHGAADLINPDLSSLRLGDDRSLSVRDLWELDLQRTRLVVLGTCQSARTGGSLVDELVTFPTAFLRAGAGSVVATLWDVGDTAAAELLDVFYSELRRGQSAADALRECQIHFEGSRSRRVRQADWAAFVCYG